MIAYAREMVTAGEAEIRPLLVEHWREIAHYQDIELDPDWEFYRAAKTVRVFTARDGGRLVGYGVFFVGPNKHYRRSIQAVQDLLFILPEYRGRTVGPRLVKYCDEQLRAEGAQVVYHHVKCAHDFGPLLAHLGYERVEGIYAKRLDREPHHHGCNSSSGG